MEIEKQRSEIFDQLSELDQGDRLASRLEAIALNQEANHLPHPIHLRKVIKRVATLRAPVRERETSIRLTEEWRIAIKHRQDLGDRLGRKVHEIGSRALHSRGCRFVDQYLWIELQRKEFGNVAIPASQIAVNIFEENLPFAPELECRAKAPHAVTIETYGQRVFTARVALHEFTDHGVHEVSYGDWLGRFAEVALFKKREERFEFVKWNDRLRVLSDRIGNEVQHVVRNQRQASTPLPSKDRSFIAAQLRDSEKRGISTRRKLKRASGVTSRKSFDLAPVASGDLPG